MRPQIITLSYADLNNSASSICASQSAVGAVNLLINGALASGGVSTTTVAQKVVITSAGDDSGITFTITGTNADNQTISEVVTGANTTTATSTIYYKTVTSILTSGSTTSTVTVGYSASNGSSNMIVTDWSQSPFNPTFEVTVSGTISYSVQVTQDDIYAIANPTWLDPIWMTSQSLTSATTTKLNSIVSPCRATRIIINSISSGASLQFRYLQGRR